MSIEKLLAEFGEREAEKLAVENRGYDFKIQDIFLAENQKACFKAGAQSVGVLLLRAVAAMKDEDNHWHSPQEKLTGSRRCTVCDALAEITRALEEGR